MLYAYFTGLFMGVLLTLAFTSTPNAQRSDGKTETCTEEAPYLMSKKYECTPAEKARLQEQRNSR